MTSSEPPSLEITSAGFELFIPPTPFSNPQPPEPNGRFVLLDDEDNVFYDVDYTSPGLRNTVSWKQLALHTIPDPAIVFPPAQWQKLKDPNWLPTGFLVSIQSREPDCFKAVNLGAVHVKPRPQALMNWDVLESLKGPELPAEMKAGLLRKVFNRRPGANMQSISYVNPRKVLDKMSRPWHRDGKWLNWELDDRFVGGKRIDEGQKWRLYAS